MVVVHEAGYYGAIGNYVLDNITYSEATTPLPAALPMFASGLGCWVCSSGTGRRKREL